MPIQNKPTLKGYGRELNIIIKIYIEESKYRSNRDSFNFKFAIFYNIYRYTNILYKTKAKAFPIILKGLALDFFYLNNTINKLSFQDICSTIQTYFKGFTKEVFKKVGKSKILKLYILLRIYRVWD